MTKDHVKDIIVAVVNGAQGCKGAELPVLMIRYLEGDGHGQDMIADMLRHDIPLYVNELIEKEDRLAEVEYILPSGPGSNKVKHFLLPKSTRVFGLTGCDTHEIMS